MWTGKLNLRHGFACAERRELGLMFKRFELFSALKA